MKSKKLNSLLMLLCLLVAGIIIQAKPVKAEGANRQSYQPEVQGSITVQLDELETKKEGVTLSCYHVGTPDLYEGNLEGWKVKKEYEGLNLDFNKLGNNDIHRSNADALAAYLEEVQSIRPLYQKKTDSNGACVFEGLSHGVYLIVQKDGFHSYGRIQPFLILVPYVEQNIWIYDIATQTKGEKPVPQTETTPPESDKPDHPTQTGDDAPVGLLFVVAVVSAIVIITGLILIIILKKKKK